jgi:hypothetical protein
LRLWFRGYEGIHPTPDKLNFKKDNMAFSIFWLPPFFHWRLAGNRALKGRYTSTKGEALRRTSRQQSSKHRAAPNVG